MAKVHGEEFKHEALARMTEQGYFNCQGCARLLGSTANRLGRWLLKPQRLAITGGHRAGEEAMEVDELALQGLFTLPGDDR